MALNRITADSITDGTIIAADVADGTITAAKLVSGLLPSAIANSAAIYANGAFTSANAAVAVNETQNNSITVALNTANAAFAQANNANANGSITAAKLDIISANGVGAVILPAGTTAQRPSGASGSIRYNTSNGQFEGYTTSDWGSIGLRNVPQSGLAKTGSYSLVAADNGQFIEIGSGGSVTIPNATFATGDIVSLFNNTTGSITITCSITTAYIGGTDSDKATVTLATRGVATILFISGTVCVISGNVT
jgi:hypothetical protein